MNTILCPIHNQNITIYENTEETLFIDDNSSTTVIFTNNEGTKYLKRFVIGLCDENCDTVIGILGGVIIVPLFNVNDFLLGLMGVFSPITNYTDILPFYPMIADFVRANNFAGLKGFLQNLITNSLMTQEEFDLLNGVLQQQNIDLNSF